MRTRAGHCSAVFVLCLLCAAGLARAEECAATFYVSRVDESAAPGEALPPGVRLLPATGADSADAAPATYPVEGQPIITGADFAAARVNIEGGAPVVAFRLRPAGAERFATATTENVGVRFAIVLDGQVISAPVIHAPIVDGSGVIEGGFTMESANDLASLLNAGVLSGECPVSAADAERIQS